MESDKRLRTEYSFPQRVKRTVTILDASDNEVEIDTIVTEIQEAVKKAVPELNLSAFPDELVFCVNAARHLMGSGDEQVFDNGLSMFFGVVLASFMEANHYRIETKVEPIEVDDLAIIEDRLTERVMKRATKASMEIHAYREHLYAELEALGEAVRGNVDENTSASKDSVGDGSSDGHDEECSEDIRELPLGGDDSAS